MKDYRKLITYVNEKDEQVEFRIVLNRDMVYDVIESDEEIENVLFANKDKKVKARKTLSAIKKLLVNLFPLMLDKGEIISGTKAEILETMCYEIENENQDLLEGLTTFFTEACSPKENSKIKSFKMS